MSTADRSAKYGSAVDQRANITAKKNTGWLVVTVLPESASIMIDNSASGSIGNVRREVPPGDHTIAASDRGLVPQRISVHIELGETLRVPLQFTRIPPPQIVLESDKALNRSAIVRWGEGHRLIRGCGNRDRNRR